MKEKITAAEATHANYHGYSDVTPHEIIEKHNEKRITVREMDAELDPNWKMDFIPGGFVGHVANSRAQTYTYTSNPDNPTRVIRLSNARLKKGCWFDKFGRRFVLSEKPYKFYDYNF